MTDVTSINLRCYTSETNATAETATVTAGSTVGFRVDPIIGHFGVRRYLVGQCRCDLTTTVASDDLYGQGAVYGERLGSVWFRVVQGEPTAALREQRALNECIITIIKRSTKSLPRSQMEL